ncbi:MAG: hypothetical protein RR585_02085 [Coprobacillus sp.]
MRKCPRCHKEMKEDCYIKDNAQPISDYELIEKDDNFKKSKYPIKGALCKECGYVELYVELER